MKKLQTTMIVAFALFAIMFGAGNVIFPVQLGAQHSGYWIKMFTGFGFSEFIITLTGYLIINQFQSVEKFGQYIGIRFIKIFFATFIISIVLVFAPRTAALSYEMLSTQHLKIPVIIFYLFYFGLCYIFILKPSSIIGIIGKYFSPTLLLIILYTFIYSFFFSHSSISSDQTTTIPFLHAFKEGFFLGYQVGDALSILLPWSLTTTMLINRGFTSIESRKQIMFYASILSIVLLAFVYIILSYLGVSASSFISAKMTTSQILIQTFFVTIGPTATLALSMIILLACFTTTIGILGVSVNFIRQELRWNPMYTSILLIVISLFMALKGVDQIIVITAPILEIIYTALILMLLVHLFKIKTPIVHKITVYTGITINMIDILQRHMPSLHFFNSIFKIIPLYSQGLVWLVPSFIIMFITLISTKNSQ